MNAPIISRRTFAKGLGGIVLAFSLDPSEMLGQSAEQRLPGSLNNNRLLSAWLRINSDGTATVFTGKVELGQGILTALHQIAAEELDLPLDRNPRASEADVRAALAGNLCRCGTHNRIIGAVLRAAKEMGRT